MPLCNLSLQVIPLTGSKDAYTVIDKVIQLIADSGIKYIVGPMETTMEGELEELLEIVIKAQSVCLAAGVERVLSVVKIDYSKTGVTIDDKMVKYQE